MPLARLQPLASHPDGAGKEPASGITSGEVGLEDVKFLLGGVGPLKGEVENASSATGERVELSPRCAHLRNHLHLDLDQTRSKKKAAQLATYPRIPDVGELAAERPLGQTNIRGVDSVHLMVDVNADQPAARPEHPDHLS